MAATNKNVYDKSHHPQTVRERGQSPQLTIMSSADLDASPVSLIFIPQDLRQMRSRVRSPSGMRPLTEITTPTLAAP